MTALLAAAVLVASGGALAVASFVVAPAPTSRLWLVAVLVAGYSLVVAGGAIVLIVLAVVAIAMGAVVLGGLAGSMAAVTFALALVPLAEGVRAARAQHVHLSARAYWSRPTWTRAGSP